MKSQKSISSNKTTNSNTSFILNTMSLRNTPKQTLERKACSTSSSKPQVIKPFLMISPKIVEEIDENNTKKIKLLFENRISQMQTTYQPKSEPLIPNPENSQISARVRKRTVPIRLSIRLPTQL